jgi:hypothetical protein
MDLILVALEDELQLKPINNITKLLDKLCQSELQLIYHGKVFEKLAN